MNKIISKDLEVLKQEFLYNFLESINSLKNNEKIVIGLSGGKSLISFYSVIKDNFGFIEKNIREKVYFCFLDERIVDFEDDYSNYKLVKSLFLDELIKQKYIFENQVLLPNFKLINFLDDYTKKISIINIGLFGVGEDGHICSLFPEHSLLEVKTNKFLEIIDSPKLPLKRITISKSMLQDINYSFIFFMGEGKRKAYKNFLDIKITYKKTPCKLILKSKKTFIFSDLVI